MSCRVCLSWGRRAATCCLARRAIAGDLLVLAVDARPRSVSVSLAQPVSLIQKDRLRVTAQKPSTLLSGQAERRVFLRATSQGRWRCRRVRLPCQSASAVWSSECYAGFWRWEKVGRPQTLVAGTVELVRWHRLTDACNFEPDVAKSGLHPDLAASMALLLGSGSLVTDLVASLARSGAPRPSAACRIPRAHPKLIPQLLFYRLARGAPWSLHRRSCHIVLVSDVNGPSFFVYGIAVRHFTWQAIGSERLAAARAWPADTPVPSPAGQGEHVS